jgi:hypothetical protein
MKILLLDIETAPNLAHVWGLWQQNVGLSQIMESGYTLCWAAKWLGEKEVHVGTIRQGERKMVLDIHSLMSEADAIVHYNGERFDIPTLNKDFLLQGLPPPAPSKQIDLLRVVKRRFRFPSNKLAYVSDKLGIGGKVEHEGHSLWVKCMVGDPDAWRNMVAYNVQDVRLLERLYEKLVPWIKGHPNHGLHNPDNSEVCPKCGSESYQRRGMEHTSSCSYQRFQCLSCHGWFRGVRNVGPKPSQKFASL